MLHYYPTPGKMHHKNVLFNQEAWLQNKLVRTIHVLQLGFPGNMCGVVPPEMGP